jgi:hypothetical protein
MDFIERHLGISPDGGEGSMEVLFLVVLVTIIVTVSLHAHCYFQRLRDALNLRWRTGAVQIQTRLGVTDG